MTDHVFVYGTLLKSLNRPAHRLLEGARLVGRGATPGALYDLGPYPCMLDAGGCTVRGEVYEIDDDATLGALDDYEGVDDMMYRRERRPLELDDGRTLQGWVYLYNRPLPASARRIESGDYAGDVGG